MLKMIIVDDEKTIRDSMRDSIDWNRIGIEIMGLCKNGLEAYDMILDESPDIVLTDIRMPALSGLELIQRITQTGQDIEFIILSGYSEFSYAKEAMRYGIKHYLLKPCNEEELVEVVQEAARLCYQKKLSRPEHQKYFQENIFRNLIMECFSEENPDYSVIVEQYERYVNFSLSYEMISLYHVERERREETVRMLREYHAAAAPSLSCYFINIDDQLLMIFESYDYDYERLDRLVKEFIDSKREAGRHSFINLFALLHELRHRVLEGKKVRLLQNHKWIRIHSQNTAYDIAEQLKEKMNAGMKPEALLAAIRQALQEIDDVESLRMVITSIFMNISQQQTNGYMTFQILEQLNQVSGGNEAEGIRRAALDRLSNILMDGVSVHTGKDFIDKTIGYVHQNLSDPELSLKKIAETELFMNVGYLSRQFQKYTGCKFSAYLAQTRIEEAKRLMATDPGISVQDVAVAVGCGNNPQYFSLLFKKHTGCKAIDYIKTMRSKN